VTAEGRGQRLDQFIQRAFSADADPPTRAEVQRWIAVGAALVNGAPTKASDAVRVGDVIRVERPLPPRSLATPDDRVLFEVVYVDDALVVVDKPAGVVVHPAKGHAAGTLVNGLLARGFFKEDEAVAMGTRDAMGHSRPGIVHRIDKGTSGLLVVARTAVAREGLKAQLARHSVLREYEALCVGDVRDAVHDTFYGRHRTDRLRFTSHLREGKRAVTRVTVVERFGVATRVHCQLETGRTHQIRVHLAESGTPILGDPLYGRSPKDPLLRELAQALGHQALHARLLGFRHPTTGEEMVFESRLPADIASAIARLEANHGTSC
jgi:23S rRNA pseudouridine1911/1915/1917 synthase